MFEFLLKRDNVEGLESADSMLVELQERQISIGTFFYLHSIGRTAREINIGIFMPTQCW